MTDESFILMDLKDKESKKIAQVISNDTSRKILDLLSNEDNITATQISKKLGVGLSTIHYNLQHLIKARLIESTDFHYSEKGKEVDHYKLSNKIVIIAPQKSKMDTLKEKLKGIIPIGIFGLCASAIIHFIYNNPFTGLAKMGAFNSMEAVGSDSFRNAMPIADSANAVYNDGAGIATQAIMEESIESAPRVMKAAMDMATENTSIAADIVNNTIVPATEPIIQYVPYEVVVQTPNTDLIGVWFFLGCVSTILIYLLIEMYRTGKNK